MLASLLMVLAVCTVRSRFDDPDLWWNLKTGEVIWTSHSIPVTDLFSYTTHHHAWIPHEWLAQLAIYGAYHCWGGYRGLMLLLCALTSVLLIAGYVLCSLYSGNAKVAFIGALLIWLFSTVGLAIRAQMFGYIFLIVELLLIELGRRRSPRWFYCLPALFAVWVNCHASFILGMIVGVVYWSCSSLTFRAGSLVAPHWSRACRRTLAISLLLSAGALFVNPVGIKQIFYPLDTLLNMPVLVGNVAEYAPLQMSSARGVALMAVLLLSFLLVMMHRAELYWHESMLLVLGTWMAVSHMRMVFVFGILAAPVLTRQLSKFWEGYEPERDRFALNAVFVGVAMAAAAFAFPSTQNLASQVEAQSPVKAVEFIRANHLAGPMLNDHAFGGYLMWAAPEHPVFVDGRTDVFEWTGVLREFGEWATLGTDPEQLLDKYGVSFCLLNPQSPMVRVLPLLHDWKVVYADTTSVIIARSGGMDDLNKTGSVQPSEPVGAHSKEQPAFSKQL
jgi:hypothetical protein